MPMREQQAVAVALAVVVAILERPEEFLFGTNQEKLFAIIDKDGIVVDAWIALSYEEAKSDNPEKTVIETTIENSPFTIGEKWIKGLGQNEKQGITS
jgi:hypothetical protein